MGFKHHNTNTSSDDMTTRIILIIFFIFIAFTIAAYFIANFLIDRSMKLHERAVHHNVEAYQPLLGEESRNDYNTFSSDPREITSQDRETRRTLRHERMRDHISAVYRISVSRLVDQVSVSSDDSDSDCEVGASYRGQGQRERDEEENSSESESENSDDSDSDSDEVVDMRGPLSMARPVLRKVAVLKAEVKGMVD
jgi:hypothetical protein